MTAIEEDEGDRRSNVTAVRRCWHGRDCTCDPSTLTSAGVAAEHFREIWGPDE